MASERKESSERGALALGSSCAGGASPRLTLPDGLTSQSQESQLVLAAADSSASWSDSSAVGADGSDRTTNSKKGSSKPQTERRRRQRINQCVSLLKNLVLEAMGKDPSQYTKLEKADVLDMAVRYVQTLRDQQQQQQQQQMQQPQMLQQPPEVTTETQSTKNVFQAARNAPVETAGVPNASLNVPLTNQRLPDNSLFLYNPGNVTGNLNGNLSHPQPTSPQYHAGFSQCSSEIELYLRMLKNVPGDLPDKVASHLKNLLSKIKAESTETLVSKEPPKITSISPSIQPILLLLNPISTTPVQTVQMVGPVASESPVHLTSNIVTTPPLQNKPFINLTNSNEKLPPESLPLHSHANQFDISSPSTSTLGGLSLSSSKSVVEGAMTPDRSPCHSVMSDKSSVGYFYFSDDTDRVASPETVTMYRCDDSFATDNVYSEPQNETPTPGTSASFSLLRSSQKSAPLACDKQFVGQSNVSGQSEDCGQPSSSSSQQYNSISFDEASRKSHAEVLQSRSLQEGELSTMWRPWHS